MLQEYFSNEQSIITIRTSKTANYFYYNAFDWMSVLRTSVVSLSAWSALRE